MNILNDPSFENVEAVVEDFYVHEETYGYGTYTSLAYKDGYLFFFTSTSTAWYISKIRTSDMARVGMYTRTGENAGNFGHVEVIGNYLYLGIHVPSPRIHKFSLDLSLISTLILPGDATYFAELYPDKYDSNILWVGSMDQDFYPILYKVNLSSFTVETYRKYTNSDFNLSGCGGAPCLTMDNTYLYVFFKYGGRVKILKSNLNSYSNYYQSQQDEFPRRYPIIYNNLVYVTFSAYRIVAFSTSDLSEVYAFDNFGYYSYYSWVEGSILLTTQDFTCILVFDMEPSSRLWILTPNLQVKGFWGHASANDCYSFVFVDGTTKYLYIADWNDTQDKIWKIRLITDPIKLDLEDKNWKKIVRASCVTDTDSYHGNYCYVSYSGQQDILWQYMSTDNSIEDIFLAIRAEDINSSTYVKVRIWYNDNEYTETTFSSNELSYDWNVYHPNFESGRIPYKIEIILSPNYAYIYIDDIHVEVSTPSPPSYIGPSKGVEAKMYIDGVEVGCVSELSFDIEYETENLFTIEEAELIKILPGGKRVKGTLRKAFVNVNLLRLLGLGEERAFKSFLFDLDVKKGNVYLKLYRCRFYSGEIRVSAEGFLEESYDFYAEDISIVSEEEGGTW